MISLVLVGFIAYVAFLMLLVYTMICGNNKFHRNGLIGKFYRFITITTLDWFNSTARKICPKCCFPDDDDEYNTCMGPKGPCRFFVAFFFYFIYMLFSLIYLINVYPNLYNIYGPESVELHKFLSIFVLPWPWVIFILFQFLDPGEIRNDNVESYLKIYPYDYVLYFPNLCPTLQIPVVPRSRYCRYTQKRIARYDHYCHWLLRPIGERTHRFFLLFLISCIIVSGYVSFGCFMHLSWRINSVKDRMSWSPSKLDNYLRIVKILMNHESMVSGTFVVLALIAIVLFIFVLQQCFYISFNILQIEQEKYEYIQEQRKLKGIKEPVVNHYNQGFWKNWLVFLFPPKVERHTPMTYRIVKKKEEGANKEGKNEDKQEEKGNITEEKGDKKEGKKKIE